MNRIIIDEEETKYFALRDGSIYSEYSKKFLKSNKNLHGYLQVVLSLENTVKICSVHRLIAQCFIENKSNLKCVNHKDNNRENNSVENLEWVSHQANSNHMVNQDRQAKGSKNGRAKLNESQVLEIRHLYSTNKYSQKELGKIYGVSQSRIGDIVRRQRWRHI